MLRKPGVLRTITVTLALGVSTASAQTLWVDTDATGPNDGSSWCNAFLHVQDALAVATAGTTIRVADGTYKPDEGAGQTPGNRAAVFVLSSGVILEGGYSGCGAPNPDERNPLTNATVLTGDLADNDLDPVNLIDLFNDSSRSENSFRIVVTNGTDSTTRLDGFHVKGATGTTNFVGSGLRADNSSLTVSNCLFSRNSNANRGAGMMTVGGNPVVLRSVFFENYAGGWGAGLRIENSSTTVKDSLFYHNESGSAGGAIHVFGNSGITSNQFIVNCTITENSSPGAGGFATVEQSAAIVTSTIVNSILWQNAGGEIGQLPLNGETIVAYSDIHGGFAGTANINLPPLFADASNADFRLTVDSPCIDAGDNTVVTEDTDLDGNQRVVNGTVDMGAYEFQGTAVPAVSEWGLVVMALLVLTAGTLVYARRRAVRA